MLIFAACVAIFVYGMVSSMLGTINPGLATKFHLDNVQTGYLALAQGVGFVIASVSGGALMDKKGKKIGLLLGLGLGRLRPCSCWRTPQVTRRSSSRWWAWA